MALAAEQTQAPAQSSDQPPLYLAFGRDDRFRDAQQLLADALPPAHVVAVDGGHDWNAWRPAWQQLLDRLPFEQRSECKAPARHAHP